MCLLFVKGFIQCDKDAARLPLAYNFNIMSGVVCTGCDGEYYVSSSILTLASNALSSASSLTSFWASLLSNSSAASTRALSWDTKADCIVDNTWRDIKHVAGSCHKNENYINKSLRFSHLHTHYMGSLSVSRIDSVQIEPYWCRATGQKEDAICQIIAYLVYLIGL